MARQTRLRGKALYHHIYAWGNDRHPVFKTENHYEAYESWLNEYSNFYFIDIIAYALMQWHIHLYVYDRFGSISDFMKALHGRYAQYYNRVNDRVGHVFGKRFSNKIVQGNTYGMWLSRYIHRQALEAGIAKDPIEYPWSSYHVYIGKKKSNFVCPEVILCQFGKGREGFLNYQKFVLSQDSGPIDWAGIKKNVIGEAEFVTNMSAQKNEKDGLAKEVEDDNDLIQKICNDFKASIMVLKRPCGWHERRLRHQVIIRMWKVWRKSVTEISGKLGMSKSAIVKIIRDDRMRFETIKVKK